MKNLYLIYIEEHDYDEYDSAIVCAETHEDARKIHPGNENKSYRDYKYYWRDHNWFYKDGDKDERTEEYSWCDPEHVRVRLIGVASDDIKIGEVICASFNAG